MLNFLRTRRKYSSRDPFVGLVAVPINASKEELSAVMRQAKLDERSQSTENEQATRAAMEHIAKIDRNRVHS